MSTQRYISTSFWDDEWIQTCDPSEKLLYLYLMTNPLTNIAGVYKITNRRISFDTGFNEDVIKYLFQKFEKSGKAYRLDEYVALPSWPKHQKWEKAPRIRDGINIILESLPESILRRLVAIKYKFNLEPVFDTLCIPYTYPSSYSDSDLNSDSDSDLNLEFENLAEGDGSPTEPASPAEPNFASADAEASQKAVATIPRKKTELAPQELALYGEIKRWFESKPESVALMYKDKGAAGRTGKALKTIVERCFNHSKTYGGDPLAIARPMVSMFHKAVYEKTGRDKLRVTFTPVGLATEWVWDTIYVQCKDHVEIGSQELIAQKIQESLRRKEESLKRGGVEI